MLKTLWSRWKHFAQKVGDFQARLILTVIYFLILGPFGLVVGFLRDPLKVKHAPQTSIWVQRESEDAGLESAMRQF